MRVSYSTSNFLEVTTDSYEENWNLAGRSVAHSFQRRDKWLVFGVGFSPWGNSQQKSFSAIA
jgi:hypothetical protein